MVCRATLKTFREHVLRPTSASPDELTSASRPHLHLRLCASGAVINNPPRALDPAGTPLRMRVFLARQETGDGLALQPPPDSARLSQPGLEHVCAHGATRFRAKPIRPFVVIVWYPREDSHGPFK